MFGVKKCLECETVVRHDYFMGDWTVAPYALKEH